VETTAPFIFDVGLVLIAAAAAGWVARHFGVPAVVGYLGVGLAVSPFTPGYVAERGQIAVLADIGVVILLFEVGIEIDFSRLRREQRSLLWLAPLQVVMTAGVTFAIFSALGAVPFGAALLGLAVAMSSSVVIVNITRSRRRTTDRPTEQALLGWSVLQDVTGVALAVIILSINGSTERPIVVALLLFAAYAGVVIAAAWGIPRALRRLRGEHDLFLLVSVASGLALAGAGAVVFGVPLALAAFVAGLSISEGTDTAEARRRLLPFRDVFAVLFFVSIGSLIDPNALGRGLSYLGIVIVLVVVAKVAVAYLLARIGRLDARPGQLAIGLGQLGEFSFVLASVGLGADALSEEHFAAVLGTVVVTIAASAVLARAVGPRKVEVPAVPAVPPGG
jgi:CPA2 family monovalent cation:H+ antiporter-2